MGGDHEWHSELLGLKDMVGNPRTCAWGIFAPSMLFGRNVNKITDGRTTTKEAALTHLAMGGCCCWCCCLPHYAAPFRQQLRTKRNLPPDPCSDLRVHIFCHPCAICQEERELGYVLASTAALIMPEVPSEPTIDRNVEDTKKHIEDVRTQIMER